MKDGEMYANHDGQSLDDFNDLDDFDKEKVFGEDEDYDVIFGEPDENEDFFSIYGQNGGIVGAWPRHPVNRNRDRNRIFSPEPKI